MICSPYGQPSDNFLRIGNRPIPSLESLGTFFYFHCPAAAGQEGTSPTLGSSAEKERPHGFQPGGEETDEAQQRHIQERGPMQNAKGLPDVLPPFGENRIAEMGTAGSHSAVGVDSPEADAQSPGHQRLGDPAVGTRMLAAVPPKDPPCAAPIPSQYPKREQHGDHGQPGGQPVGPVIQPGGGPPQIPVPLVAIAHHRI